MSRIPIPSFIGSSRSSSNAMFDPSNTINMYIEKGGSGAKTQRAFLREPGKLRFCNMGGDLDRRLYVTGKGRVFGVCGQKLIELLSDGSFVQRGLLSSFFGVVSIADTETQLGIVDGLKGYIYDLNADTLTPIASIDFPNGASQICALNQRFLCPVPGTGFFRWSDVLDGANWNLFDEASAEGMSDIIVALVAVQGQAWALGTRSKEVFYDTGLVDFTFDRVPGSVSDHGCLSAFSPQVIGAQVYWFGAEAGGSPGVFQSSGYNIAKITDPAREADMATWSDKESITALTYEQRGHIRYQISSIAGKKTWCYDIREDSWTQKMSRDPISGEEGRDIAEFHVFAFGKNLVGDYRNGRVYELSPTTYTEDGATLIIERTGGNLSDKGKRIFLKTFGISIQAGVGDPGECSSDTDPQAMLTLSYDSGVSFGVERWRSMGRAGQYAKQLEWRRLGWGYNIVPRIRISAAVPVAIFEAYADITRQA